VTFNQRDFPADALTSCGIVISASRRASVRWPSVCATGRPSRPRAFGLSATHDLFAPLRDAAAVLRASRALFWRTRGSPTITGRRIDVLAGGLRPPARTYASRGLRALASLSMARSVCGRSVQHGHSGGSAARRQHATVVNPPFDVNPFLDILRRQGLIQTTKILGAYRSLI
jgi:hypothetical protein